MKRFTSGKRPIVMLVVALVVLSVGVSIGGAKSGPTQIKSNLYLGEVDPPCPPSVLSKKSAGTVTIMNVKGAWTIVVHMHGAKPGDYHVDLRESPTTGNPCDQFASTLGHFKVDANGEGDDQVPYSASGFQSFYLRVHEGDQEFTYITPLLKIGGNPS
jgi:hypothetical protein